jgi:uncharacterized membrane protein YuzA (DUF378 family)
MDLRPLDILAVVLLIIGALNWGLMGFFGFNLVSTLFGTLTGLARLVYALVGLAAIYGIVQWGRMQCRLCGS